jgi:hypothetical protein|tara:strand:- start:170 stop:817 length:648 start_codon:yes stop_codon:yes gene_type:complete
MTFTYAQLKTSIQDYTENSETSFVNSLPVFIRLAEERILKNVQLNFFRKNVTGVMTSSNKFLACPSDFLSPFSLSFIDSSGNHVFLEYKDVDFIQTFNPSNSNGVPKYYAFFDIDNFIIGPVPNSNYSIELHYFYRPTSLTAGLDSGITWLSENAEMALLYGSLLEAYIYMKGEADMLAQYEKRFVEAIQSLKQFGESKEVMDMYRNGKVMRPPQ